MLGIFITGPAGARRECCSAGRRRRLAPLREPAAERPRPCSAAQNSYRTPTLN